MAYSSNVSLFSDAMTQYLRNWIYMYLVDFLPFFKREITFVTACSLSRTTIPF